MKTEIVKPSNKAIEKAISVLQKGGIVIYPTETQYGIGADATSRKAVKKAFVAKNRPKEKKFIIAFSDLAMAKKYLHLDENALRAAGKFMPGPLSLIVRGKGNLAIRGNVAFRMPKHPLALAIIRKFRKPITTTSANLSGQKPIYSIKDITKAFDGKVNLIIDAGNPPRRRPSTVFDMQTKRVLRKGPVGEHEILRILE